VSLRRPEEWDESGDTARRSYRRYKDYLKHQAAKLGTLAPIDLVSYHENFRDELVSRLTHVQVAGSKALCLGARSGAEVQAFIRCGAFAVGIDLNPGLKNKYVLVGDFHKLVFATGSVDVVYTNSLDHVFDFDKVLGEARRVLRLGGLLIVEAIRGYKEGGNPGEFESFAWTSVDDLVRLIAGHGFELVNRFLVEAPWPGEHLMLEKV
jgi:SAM-dependent methyltransferase